MKLAMAAFGIATLVGVGYVIGKKITEKKKEQEFYDLNDFDEIDDDEIDVGVYAKESYKDKVRKASLFAVGAIKTGADKFGETIQDIKTKDMVKKGEKAFDAVKETGGNIKNDIKKDVDDLKSMVSAISDEEELSAEDLFDDVKDAANDVVNEVKDVFGSNETSRLD